MVSGWTSCTGKHGRMKSDGLIDFEGKDFVI